MKLSKNKNILINNKKCLYFGKYYAILAPTKSDGGIVMNWNKDKSVKLSKFCVYLFMLILVGVCIGAPWLFRLLVNLRAQDLSGKFALFLLSTYTAAVPAAAALYGLWRLLRNISEGEVFIGENVAILRLLSWCCIAAGLVCLFSALYYMPFLIISAAAAFVGLILRVVKNVFAEAVRLKDENDYTI